MLSVGGCQEPDTLVKVADKFRTRGWAESTKRVYRSQLQCYLNFCQRMSISVLPVSTEGISMYIAYLAHVKKLQFQTIANYLVIVKHLHKSNGFKDPIKDNWQVEHLLQGVKRVLGVAQGCAVPITPDMLLCVKKHLDLYKLFHLSVWSACLIGFFGMLRPGNFLMRDKSVPVLRICQLESRDMDYIITFDYTKTIQFRQKQLRIIIPYLSEHPLCPASALFRLLSLHVLLGSDGQTPLLCETVSRVLSYDIFISFINDILFKEGYEQKVTGHSFRRGGATWAFNSGCPGEVIQDIGFWKSDAYLRYIETNTDTKSRVMHNFGAKLPTNLR